MFIVIPRLDNRGLKLHVVWSSNSTQFGTPLASLLVSLCEAPVPLVNRPSRQSSLMPNPYVFLAQLMLTAFPRPDENGIWPFPPGLLLWTSVLIQVQAVQILKLVSVGSKLLSVQPTSSLTFRRCALL